MAVETELTEVMDAIYFAAHQKDGWQSCLGLISRISGGETAQLLILNKEGDQLVAGYQSHPHVAADSSGNEIAPRLCHARHEVGNGLVELTVQRPSEDGEFTPVEKQLIKDLMPHIARAIRQEGASRLLNDRQAAVQRQKQGALLLLDGQQNVVFLSSEAERLLLLTATVTLVAGRLRLGQRRKQAELDELIRRCFESKATGMVNLNESDQIASRILVSTVQPRDSRLFQSHGLVAVFIVSGQGEQCTEEDVISQWLGLTESESRIASLIAQGRRPAEIASDIALSVHTVRHHIKNICRKTGAHSQSQLTAIVLNLPV